MSSAYDAIVVGAGFGGLSALHELRERGVSTRLLEAGDGIGGVWWFNRYPGARVDTESFDYAYSFSPELEQDWSWSERYAAQPELCRYLEHVVERFGLAEDIQLSTAVVSAHYDEEAARWTVTTADGEVFDTQHLVMAVGLLSAAHIPSVPGAETFAGRSFHTSAWPGDVDLEGQRVGVIGTGSSGVQVIPEIARLAAHLSVFQRSANHVVPAQNRPTDPEHERRLKATSAERRKAAAATGFGLSLEQPTKATKEATPEEREAEYQRRWELGGFNFLLAFNDILLDADANHSAAEFVRRKIRETVHDPETAEKLVPGSHPLGTKRISVGIDYLETYNRDNVSLYDAKTEPIVRIAERGVVTTSGLVELDVLVFATGFDAYTGSLTRIDLRGRGGLSLKAHWADGPTTLMGLGTSSFPNLFVVAGPGSSSALSNLPVYVELHTAWIAECIVYLREHGFQAIEADRAAELAWSAHVQEVADMTLHRGNAGNSWYTGANIDGKAKVFMAYLGGVPIYTEKLRALVADGYAGFALR